jgi:hypothetical protein
MTENMTGQSLTQVVNTEQRKFSTPQARDFRTGQRERSDWWAVEPDVGRVAHGVASRVDRLRCIGNGQVPQAMRLAWLILSCAERRA